MRRRPRSRSQHAVPPWARPAVAGLAVLVGLAAAGCTDIDGGRGTGAPPAPSPSTTAPASTPSTTAQADGVPGAASVDRLRVASPDPAVPPYRRDEFGNGWDYDPATGCNTRERVLIEESAVPPRFEGSRCRPTYGRWTSRYDGLTTTDPADLEIDHLVPLADAWRSGAATWTRAEREAFANDLENPEVLIAVTASTNRSKGDSTPDRWLPPDRSAWCEYATDWVSVKARYRLSVTPAEKATLVQVLSGC